MSPKSLLSHMTIKKQMERENQKQEQKIMRTKSLFLVLKEIGLLIDLIVVTKELALFQVNQNPQKEITKKKIGVMSEFM